MTSRRQAFRNLPRGLTSADVRRHMMTPPIDESVDLQQFVDSADDLVTFDLAAFGAALHSRLKDSVIGYVLQVRRKGSLVHAATWGWAQTPADNSIAWSENVRMHVASVSKFLTGVALVKALTGKSIPFEAKIIDYLPDHWSKGINIERIDFRQLLTHTSGLAGKSTYMKMKEMIAAGVPRVGGYDYQNVNFALCRVLFPLINGSWEKGRVFSRIAADNDAAWDLATSNYYRSYMQDALFAPAGVTLADLGPPRIRLQALAYSFPDDGSAGWDQKDSASFAGGVGWRLSPRELLDVMHTVRREDTIISSEMAQYMLDNSFGVDVYGSFDTPAGKVLSKSGYIYDPSKKKFQQCVACFLPRDMELVLFVNSLIGPIMSSRRTPRAALQQALLEAVS